MKESGFGIFPSIRFLLILIYSIKLLTDSKIVHFDLKALRSYFSERKANATDDWHLDDPFVFFGELLRYVITAVRHRSFNASQRGMLK